MPHYPKPFFRKSRQLWYVQIGGRQVNLGPDRDVAFTHYRDLMAAPKSSLPVARTSTAQLVVVLCDRFLEWVQLHRSAGTYQWYWWRLQNFCRRYPELTIDELRPYHVQEWVDGQNIATTTQRNCIRAVKRSIKWANRQGYIDSNPLVELDAPSAGRREVLISDDEYGLLLQAIQDPGFYDLIVTTWETGCRPQESLRVEARHVDLKNQRWVFPKSESKTKQLSRVVYLTDTAMTISRGLLSAYPAGPLFRNSRGDAWTNYAVQCAFRRVKARVGKLKMRDRLNVPDREVDALTATLPASKNIGDQSVAKTVKQLRAELIGRALAEKQSERH